VRASFPGGDGAFDVFGERSVGEIASPSVSVTEMAFFDED